jgi:hypothetical protein
MFILTIAISLALIYPILYANLYQYKLRNSLNSPSNHTLHLSNLKMPKGSPPTPMNINLYISAFLKLTYDIDDIAYIIPCYELQQYWMQQQNIKL